VETPSRKPFIPAKLLILKSRPIALNQWIKGSIPSRLTNKSKKFNILKVNARRRFLAHIASAII
jgi:macrodomain Ter protein organizer (MatP/YcbG family)